MRWFALFLLAACAPVVDRDADVLAVGDSILAWNRLSGQDIPKQVADRTGLGVTNLAVNGADFLENNEIPEQYVPGAWRWVMMTGGGNDLGKVCLFPRRSAAVLDQLIAEDLSGAYADFIGEVRANGARVILVGYAPVSIRGGPFEACAEVLGELRTRQARLADTDPGVFFVDGWSVIAPDDLDAYSIDRVHPTPYAGALVSGLVAEVMSANP